MEELSDQSLAYPQGEETQTPEIPELPEKFLFEGQPWTREDLKNAYLRHQDYTKKTQEISTQRKEYEESKKYLDNLEVDYQRVMKDPSLVKTFMEVYPAKFHHLVRHLATDKTTSVDPETQARLERVEQYFRQQEVEKAEGKINQAFTEYGTKYPMAMRSVVLSMAQAAHEQGIDLNNENWEKIFKKAHAQVEEQVKKHYGTLVNKQKEASARSKDIGPGGSAPGQAPVNPKNLREATQIALNDAKLGQGAFAR